MVIDGMSHYDLAPLLVCFCHGWIMGGGDDDSSGEGCFHPKSDTATKKQRFLSYFQWDTSGYDRHLDLSALWLPQPMSRCRCQSRVSVM